MGIMHLVRTQAACIYLFHFHKLILCGFNQIFLNHKWVFFNHNQSISTTKQSQTIIRYQSIFTPITTNKYRPWFVDEGRIYIFIYIAFHFYFNTYIIFTTHIQLIHRTYNLYNAYTRGVQCLYNSYIDYIIYTSSFSISFLNQKSHIGFHSTKNSRRLRKICGLF